MDIFTTNLFWPIGPFDLRFMVAACVTNVYVYYCTGLSPTFSIAMIATLIFGVMLVISENR